MRIYKNKTLNPKWDAGFLQWGHEIQCITKDAEQRLKEMKKEHPDWDFEQLANDLRNSNIKAWLYE